MLQQTTADVVAGRFDAFMKRFPTPAALAAAGEDAVVAAWSGLGYYRRARFLHRGAKAAVDKGGIPKTFEALRELPGLGAYAAGAVASLAFGERVAAVDGNTARVMARYGASDANVATEKGRASLAADVLRLMPKTDPGSFNEALIELGAKICKPSAPRCDACPLANGCEALRLDAVADFPRRAPRTATTALVSARAFVRRGNRVLLSRRPEDASLLAGFEELPGRRAAPGESAEAALRDVMSALGVRRPTIGRRLATAAHVITRYRLSCVLHEVVVPPTFRAPPATRFAPIADLLGPRATTETRKLAVASGLASIEVAS